MARIRSKKGVPARQYPDVRLNVINGVNQRPSKPLITDNLTASLVVPQQPIPTSSAQQPIHIDDKMPVERLTMVQSLTTVASSEKVTHDKLGIIIDIDMLDEGRYGEYETFLRNLAKRKEDMLGMNNPETLHILNLLGVLLTRMKRVKESESMYRKTIKICSAVDANDELHSSYDACKSTAQNNLACLMLVNNNIAEASTLLNGANSIRSQIFGGTDLYCHNILHNKANIEFLKSNYRAAADLYREALPHRKFASEVNNFNICDTQRSLADALYRAGNFPEAEIEYKQLLSGLNPIIGEGHNYSLYCRNRLASSLLEQQKLSEAEAVMCDVLSTVESDLETDIPTDKKAEQIMKIKSQIADLLYKQKKYAAAELLYVQALPCQMPETADSIAQCLSHQGKLQEASQFYKAALDWRESSLGPHHPATLHAVCIFGDIHTRSHNFEAALGCFQRAFESYQRELGLDNFLTLSVLDNIARTYEKMNCFEEAQSRFLTAMTGFEKVLGPTHVITIKTVRNLGNLYRKQNKLADAEILLLRVLISSEEINGISHIETIRIISSIAILQKKQNNLNDAEIMYRRALRGYEVTFGVNSKDALSTLNNLGILYKAKNDFQQAREVYDRALVGRQKLLGVSHADTLCTMNNIAVLLSDQEHFEEAEILYEKVLDGFNKNYGSDHIETKRARNNLSLLQKRKHFIHSTKGHSSSHSDVNHRSSSPKSKKSKY